MSLLGTAAVGVLFMPVRSCYFYMYYPLTAFSIAYLYQSFAIVKVKRFFIGFVYLVSLVNLFSNIIPCVNTYHSDHDTLASFSEKVLKSGASCLYYHTYSLPLLVQYSQDLLEMGDFRFTYDKDDSLFSSVLYLNSEKVFDGEHKSNCLIALSDSAIALLRSDDTEYNERLFSNLEKVDELYSSRGVLYLYKPKEGSILFL